MQKRLFMLIVLLSMVANVSLAKEFRIESTKAVFDIPNSYLVATRDNIPDSVIQRTGLSKQQIFDYLSKSTTVLLAYKENHMIEITSVVSDNSKKVIDNVRVPEEQANAPQVLDILKNRMQNERHWTVNNVLSRKIGNARYYVADGMVTVQGGTLYIRYYTTIKNSVGLGITGQSLIPSNKEMTTDLESIVKNIRFDNENSSIGNSQSNVQPSQINFSKKNNVGSFLGKALGKALLIAIIAAIVQIFRYLKNRKNDK